MDNEKKIRYFSMFTGAGGFELGIGDRGECVGFSEINKFTNELLKKRFPNITNYGDCTKIQRRALPDFDLLCGGFPCQTFSIAGKRKGFNDTRGTMFFEIARILEVKRPKIVFLENVKGLLNHEKGKTFKVILQTLDELGYEVQWMVFNSKFFGVPQNRERVFIIGSLRGESRPKILPFRESSQKNIQEREINEGQEVAWALRSRDYKDPTNIIGCVYRTRTYAKIPGRIEMRKDNIANQLTSVQKDSMVIMDLYNHSESSEVCPTLKDPCHNDRRVRKGKMIRKLTPLECERLQGFPEGWTEGFSDTQRLIMMGNAVTVNVIKAIAERLFK